MKIGGIVPERGEDCLYSKSLKKLIIYYNVTIKEKKVKKNLRRIINYLQII